MDDWRLTDQEEYLSNAELKEMDKKYIQK